MKPIQSTNAPLPSPNAVTTLLTGGLLAGLVAVTLFSCGDSEATSTSQKDTLQTVQPSTRPEELVGIAVVEPADRISQLSAPTGGLVKHINVKIGQPLKRGQLLLTMDNAVESAQLRQASVQISSQQEAIETARRNVQRLQVQLKKAQADLTRNQTLFAGNTLTRKELDDSQYRANSLDQQIRASQAQVRQAEGQIRSLRTDIQYAGTVAGLKTVQAASDGTLLSLDAKVGQFLSSNQSIVDFAPAGSRHRNRRTVCPEGKRRAAGVRPAAGQPRTPECGYGGMAEQKIYDATSRFDRSINQLNVESGQATLKKLTIDVRQQVTEAYYQAVFMGEKRRLSAQARQRAEDRQLNELSGRKEQARLAPVITAYGAYVTQQLADTFNPLASGTWFPYNYVGQRVSVPLFDGRQTRLNRQDYVKRAQSNQNTLQQLRNEVDYERRSAPNTLEQARENLTETRKNIVQARQILAIDRVRFDAGTLLLADFRNSEYSLQQAGNNYLRAVYEVLRGQVALQKAVGSL